MKHRHSIPVSVIKERNKQKKVIPLGVAEIRLPDAQLGSIVYKHTLRNRRQSDSGNPFRAVKRKQLQTGPSVWHPATFSKEDCSLKTMKKLAFLLLRPVSLWRPRLRRRCRCLIPGLLEVGSHFESKDGLCKTRNLQICIF